MTKEQLDAICEYVDGRRAAGDRWDVIEEALAGGVPEETLERLPELHRRWQRARRYEAQQAVVGDLRQGNSVGAITVDWAAADEAALKLAVSSGATADPTLAERAEALRVIEYLRTGLLQERWAWKFLARVPIDDDAQWVDMRGPGEVWLRDGRHVEWRARGVVVRRIIPAGERPKGSFSRDPRRHLQIERMELDAAVVDPREISARLAALIHTFLGSAGSPWRNNAELAGALGVSRQAIQMRRKRLMRAAGARAGEGLRSVQGI
jgi:hypothetical protein